MKAWCLTYCLPALLSSCVVDVGAAASASPDLPLVGVSCRPALAGGAAPPQILSVDDSARLHELLRPFRPEAMQTASARSLKQALCDAGLWQQPAGQRALAAAGFDVKAIDLLAPEAAPAAVQASSPLRRLPRRE